MSIATVVLGANGYVGGELLRLLYAHPDFNLAAAISRSSAGRPVGSVFPHLAQAYAGRTFVGSDEWINELESGADVAFFSAAPHGASATAIAHALRDGADRNLNMRVVDASADFRFADAATFANVYGIEHPDTDLLQQFTCAVPEQLASAPTPHVAHPGCFATATLLASLPLTKNALVDGHLFVHGVTGSTGSGRNAVPGTHHPERHSNLYAYKPLAHRHAPEVESLLTAAGAAPQRVHFVPHSGPFARGIHVTVQARLAPGSSANAVRHAFAEAYADATFVHLVDGTPRLKDVVASNHANIGVAADEDSVTVMCAIDNLVKGAAGGAWQWMNRLWSIPEARGLTATPPAWT